MQYLGGKAKIAKQLVEFLQKHTFEVYIEPFVGGCNVALL
jgi:site-specific DNA-adenine methylase